MILKSQKKDKSRRRHPVTMVESVMVMCVLFLFFFGLVQIMEWCYGFIFCQYSAYYASKSKALGYRNYMSLRAARVAAISISGPPQGNVSANRASDFYRAEDYMMQGDASGVRYRFWGNAYKRTGTQLKLMPVSSEEYGPGEIIAKVALHNSQYLGETDNDKGIGPFLHGAFYKDPEAKVITIDQSHYLEVGGDL